MSDANVAMHAIRNDLSPILFFAELANAGDCEAQRLVIDQLVQRTEAIRAELDVLDDAVRHSKRQDRPKGKAQDAKCIAHFTTGRGKCGECDGTGVSKD